MLHALHIMLAHEMLTEAAWAKSSLRILCAPVWACTWAVVLKNAKCYWPFKSADGAVLSATAPLSSAHQLSPADSYTLQLSYLQLCKTNNYYHCLHLVCPTVCRSLLVMVDLQVNDGNGLMEWCKWNVFDSVEEVNAPDILLYHLFSALFFTGYNSYWGFS